MQVLTDVAVADTMEPTVLLGIVGEFSVAAVIGLLVTHEIRHALGGKTGGVDAVFFADGPGLVAVHENKVFLVKFIRKDDLDLRDLDGVGGRKPHTAMVFFDTGLDLKELVIS